jgi:hypothetical protein
VLNLRGIFNSCQRRQWEEPPPFDNQPVLLMNRHDVCGLVQSLIPHDARSEHRGAFDLQSHRQSLQLVEERSRSIAAGVGAPVAASATRLRCTCGSSSSSQ